ncbi:Uma2 family endonuclease [Spirulina sp. CS-785/01]|nr:Uma2 family endonuclease [Spirulina sp. CS-785/01]MDB9311883.1 Uma2 family endonuclease [Spirulina sp. CS-785/01]
MTPPTYNRTQTDPPLPPEESLPTMYDLPSENPEDPGLDDFHAWQPQLLQETFNSPNYRTDQVYSAMDLNLYYDVNHPLWYKKPDWFGVVGVPRLYRGEDLRLSYVMWQEGVAPFVVVELLSPGTEDEDLGTRPRQEGRPPTKWEVYEQILRIPYYVLFSRYTNELQVFHLLGGHYERVNLTHNRIVMPEIGLSLGVWEGEYKGLHRP